MTTKTKGKRAFTLLEILLVIAIIGVSLGVLGISLPKVLKKEKVRSGVDVIASKILLAQELAFDYSADVTLKLIQQPKGLECRICSPQLPELLLHKLNKDNFIAGIEEMRLGDASKKELLLPFSSSFVFLPPTLLSFHGKHVQTLFLPGYPGKLFKQKQSTHALQATYPQEILSSH